MNTSIIFLSIAIFILLIMNLILRSHVDKQMEMIVSIFTYLYDENGITVKEIHEKCKEYVDNNIDITGVKKWEK